MNVKIDMDGAIAHYKNVTGEELSIQEVINRTGIGRMTLYNYSKGKSMGTVENLVKISNLTGYPLEKLIVNSKSTKK